MQTNHNYSYRKSPSVAPKRNFLLPNVDMNGVVSFLPIGYDVKGAPPESFSVASSLQAGINNNPSQMIPDTSPMSHADFAENAMDIIKGHKRNKQND